MSLLKKGLASKPKLEPLFAVVLGSSGAGKSGLAGTLGVRTLVLRTPVESHGGTSARSVSKSLFSEDNVVEIDIMEDAANADEAWANLLSTISDPELPKHFGAVVMDSLTDLQTNLFHDLTEWKETTQTKDGKRNKLAEPGADAELFNELINRRLKKLTAKGVHVVMLAAAQVITMGDSGDEVVAKPGLQGANPAALINRSCPDVLLVNKVRDADTGNWEHRLLFYPKVSKESKTIAGVVTKTENFNMRVSHIPSDKLPESAAARLDELIEFRQKCFNGEV